MAPKAFGIVMLLALIGAPGTHGLPTRDEMTARHLAATPDPEHEAGSPGTR